MQCEFTYSKVDFDNCYHKVNRCLGLDAFLHPQPESLPSAVASMCYSAMSVLAFNSSN